MHNTLYTLCNELACLVTNGIEEHGTERAGVGVSLMEWPTESRRTEDRTARPETPLVTSFSRNLRHGMETSLNVNQTTSACNESVGREREGVRQIEGVREEEA